ncbi:hypothetical protein D3C87_1543390 [compost metagenome]
MQIGLSISHAIYHSQYEFPVGGNSFTCDRNRNPDRITGQSGTRCKRIGYRSSISVSFAIEVVQGNIIDLICVFRNRVLFAGKQKHAEQKYIVDIEFHGVNDLVSVTGFI